MKKDIHTKINFDFFVPVQLCSYILAQRLTPQFRLYCFLKGICSGKLKIGKLDIKSIAANLNVDPKTVKVHLRNLIKLNWVGLNPKSKYFFIRGFDAVMRLLQFKARTGAEFRKEYLDNFKSFLAGAVIGYLTNTIRKRQAAERQKSRSNHAVCPSVGYQISNRFIAKKLNVSLGFAHKMKKLAANAGFIKLSKHFIDTGVPATEKRYYRRAFPEHSGRLRQKEGRLVLVDSDKVFSAIRFKKRKKRER